MAQRKDLATIHDTAPAHADMFSDERLKLIRDTVAKGAPPEVFAAMIEVAKARNLDPLAKQIGVAKFDKNGGWQMYMPIDGYRAVAGDQPDYAGMDEPRYGPDAGKTPLGKTYPEWCTVTVYRMVAGQRCPFGATVYWEEYYGGDRNFSWNKMPRTMLSKVAESHALRKAFTRSLSGVYTVEELAQAGPIDVEHRPVDRTTGEIVDVSAHNAPVERSEARSETKPADTTPDTPTWQQASTALHAEAGKHGIDHEHVKAWLIQASMKAGNPITSTKDASAQTLTFVRTQKLAKDPDKFRQQAEEALNSPDIYALCYPDQAEPVFPPKPEVEVVEAEPVEDTDAEPF